MSAQTCDILTYSLYRGDATSQHTFDLARVLAHCGIRPAIYSNHPPHDLPADIFPIAQQAHYRSYTPQADITILQYPLWFPLAERFRTAPGTRLFWYHGVTPPEQWPVPQEADLLRTSQIRTELANFAHLAVTASPFTAAELQSHAGYPPERTRVVPLGVDIPAYSMTPDPSLLSQLRARWRLNDRRVVLYVGRVAGNKRIDLAIDALAKLRSTFPDLHLLLVGDDSSGIATQVLVEQLRQHAQDLGLVDYVTFAGRVPDVAPYYHLADCFVLPSQHEGFGVPLIEAMAAGTCVVASASGAMQWLLSADASDTDQVYQYEPEAAGLLFTPGDADHLAQRLAEVLSNADLRAHLLQGGVRRANEFSLQAFRVRAALTIFEAIENHAAGDSAPETVKARSDLYGLADTIQRDFAVTSRVPLLGKLIERARMAATLHLKEAYFDRVMEQQVSFNRRLADGILALEERLDSADSPYTHGNPP